MPALSKSAIPCVLGDPDVIPTRYLHIIIYQELLYLSYEQAWLWVRRCGEFFAIYVSLDQFNKPGQINPDVQRQTTEALLTGSHPPVECCMRPEFIRLAPPLHMSEDEVIVMHDPILVDYYFL